MCENSQKVPFDIDNNFSIKPLINPIGERSKTNQLKSFVKNLVQFLISMLSRINADVIFVSPYVKFSKVLKLAIKLGQVPSIESTKFRIEDLALNLDIRSLFCKTKLKTDSKVSPMNYFLF